MDATNIEEKRYNKVFYTDLGRIETVVIQKRDLDDMVTYNEDKDHPQDAFLAPRLISETIVGWIPGAIIITQPEYEALRAPKVAEHLDILSQGYGN